MLDTMRTAMIDRQLRTTGVNDPAVLAAIRAVDRERFVPAARRALAYSDAAIELVPGRWLMEPMTFGLLLTHAAVQPVDRVLVIGAATGYSAAVLARLTPHVTALEEDADLAAAARSNGITIAEGALIEGWAGAAPYDLMLFDGAIMAPPQSLLAQLADGARLAAVMIGDDGVGRATVGRYAAGHFAGTSIIEAGIPLLPGFAPRPMFVF